ncbi:response regulator (plasmid) [Mycobacterium sp. JS623]|uniref:helix-turn-helix transcriptional regulator n=1 Tax=Mycobacterium sp. JS623 TaxID=212767 RepID=UPI0002A599E4|nr:helix-turn-helix transcriptional regulator [Mycobacterium sp. JS623]AGB26793.1 response regulator [Mycobacterium sp. JS623]
MVSVDDFSKMVSAVYACAVDPGQAAESITTIYQTLGARGGALLVAQGAVRNQIAAVLPADAAETYRHHYWRVDHVLDDVEAGPVGVVRTGSELMTPDHRSEFLNEWNRPNDLEDGMFVRLTSGRATTTFLVTAPRRTEPFGSAERLKAMNALTGHLQQALRTYDKFAESGRVNNGLVAMVDGMRHGTALVGPAGFLRCLNSSAELILQTADGLSLHAQCITATVGSAQAQLGKAIHTAIVGDRDGIRCGRSMLCARPSGRRPYVVHIVPSQPDDAGALMIIVDPEHQTMAAPALLAQLFSLTRAESQIASGIARGAPPKQLAEEMSVSLVTVRTHLQHVFDKTDTHRQADLARLLTNLLP